jgi:hypothetical protein
MNNGTALIDAEFAGAVVACLPRTLLSETMEMYKEDRGRLRTLLANAFAEAGNPKKPGWLTKILDAEREAHRNFFGKEFDLTEFENKLRQYGRMRIRQFRQLGLEPHYMPPVAMLKDSDWPGWKIKPEEWFFMQTAAGKILRAINGELVAIKEPRLEYKTVLIDTRLKPAYDDGKQMYENDNLLGQIIADLRQNGKIQDYQIRQSRFNVSAREWEEHIKPALAEKLGLPASQVRLETTMERNVIPQLYKHMPRQSDHQTNTSVWCEEYFEDRGSRLDGGNSDYGGLANAFRDDSGSHWGCCSFRPLAVL